jgi:hypothetical protein
MMKDTYLYLHLVLKRASSLFRGQPFYEGCDRCKSRRIRKLGKFAGGAVAAQSARDITVQYKYMKSDIIARVTGAPLYCASLLTGCIVGGTDAWGFSKSHNCLCQGVEIQYCMD